MARTSRMLSTNSKNKGESLVVVDRAASTSSRRSASLS